MDSGAERGRCTSKDDFSKFYAIDAVSARKVLRDAVAVLKLILLHHSIRNGRTPASVGGLRRSFEAAHRDEIFVADRAYVPGRQLDKGLCLTRSSHELHVKAIRLIHSHYRTEIADAKPVLRQVAFKDDGVEHPKLQGFSPGMAVTNLGKFSSCRTIQTVSTRADRPDGPVSIAEISYLFPNRLNLPWTPSSTEASFRTSRSKSAQFCCVYSQNRDALFGLFVKAQRFGR